MMNIDKMQDITDFYQDFLQAIRSIRGSMLHRDAEKKLMLLRWLDARQKKRSCRSHCKSEILSMYAEVEAHPPEVLERRIRTLYENCACILAQLRAPAVRRYA